MSTFEWPVLETLFFKKEVGSQATTEAGSRVLWYTGLSLPQGHTRTCLALLLKPYSLVAIKGNERCIQTPPGWSSGTVSPACGGDRLPEAALCSLVQTTGL